MLKTEYEYGSFRPEFLQLVSHEVGCVYSRIGIADHVDALGTAIEVFRVSGCETDCGGKAAGELIDAR